MELIGVDDPADPRLADFRELTDADVRPDRRGVVIVEGRNAVARLAASPYPVRAVFGVPARIEMLREAFAALDVPAYVADKWLISDVVGFRVTRGVLASAARPAPPPLADLLTSARRLVVAESLNDFENLGALFRNAAAFGVDAVLLDRRCADPLYRRSVRVSMGHVLQVPFAVLADPLASALGGVRTAGFELLAMTPRADATPLRSVQPRGRWAVLVGAEGPGLTETALAAADLHVRIPMAGGVDSLNVATAAAVALAHLSQLG